MIRAPDSLDNVENIAVGVPDAIEPSLVVEIHSVGDQSVSLPMPNRVPHPQGPERSVMRRPVCKKRRANGGVLEEQDDFAGRLNDLHGKRMKINAWQAGRSASVVKRVVGFRQG